MSMRRFFPAPFLAVVLLLIAAADAITCWTYKHVDSLSAVGSAFSREVNCGPKVSTCITFQGTYMLPKHPVENLTATFYDGGCGPRDEHVWRDDREDEPNGIKGPAKGAPMERLQAPCVDFSPEEFRNLTLRTPAGYDGQRVSSTRRVVPGNGTTSTAANNSTSSGSSDLSSESLENRVGWSVSRDSPGKLLNCGQEWIPMRDQLDFVLSCNPNTYPLAEKCIDTTTQFNETMNGTSGNGTNATANAKAGTSGSNNSTKLTEAEELLRLKMMYNTIERKDMVFRPEADKKNLDVLDIVIPPGSGQGEFRCDVVGTRGGDGNGTGATAIMAVPDTNKEISCKANYTWNYPKDGCGDGYTFGIYATVHVNSPG